VTASPNLDLVRSILGAWERGDYSSADWADPEIEYAMVDGPEPGRWKGLAEMAEAARKGLDAWKDIRFEIEEYRELDDERVLVLHHASGSGKASGLELGQMRTNAAHLFHLRRGKVTRLVNYWDRDRALADLGLAPEGDASAASS
jgi:ketosteroid isomerase-like protein